MNAEIVPFPITRRRAFVAKQSHHAAWMRPAAAERHIEYQIKVQADTMRRKGVEEALIRRELRCMEAAVRASLQRLLMGGAA